MIQARDTLKAFLALSHGSLTWLTLQATKLEVSSKTNFFTFAHVCALLRSNYITYVLELLFPCVGNTCLLTADVKLSWRKSARLNFDVYF